MTDQDTTKLELRACIPNPELGNELKSWLCQYFDVFGCDCFVFDVEQAVSF